MATETQRLWLTFDAASAQKPLLCQMTRQFDVVFNIRNASVTKEVGIIGVEFEGDRQAIKSGIAWLESQGVAVEPIEINTIEG
jgi:L-aspartate semialdehyde sulfurtransferase ferredoxin